MTTEKSRFGSRMLHDWLVAAYFSANKCIWSNFACTPCHECSGAGRRIYMITPRGCKARNYMSLYSTDHYDHDNHNVYQYVHFQYCSTITSYTSNVHRMFRTSVLLCNLQAWMFIIRYVVWLTHWCLIIDTMPKTGFDPDLHTWHANQKLCISARTVCIP